MRRRAPPSLASLQGTMVVVTQVCRHKDVRTRDPPPPPSPEGEREKKEALDALNKATCKEKRTRKLTHCALRVASSSGKGVRS